MHVGNLGPSVDKGAQRGAACPKVGFCADFNNLRHVFGELFCIPLVETSNLVFSVVTKCAGQLCGANPKIVLVGNGGQVMSLKQRAVVMMSTPVVGSWHCLRIASAGCS